jgi:two-component system, LytTR family, response regulator LytT
MKIALIEDEKITANDLAKIIKSLDSTIEIVAFITSVEEGIAFFSKPHEIDLLFSDIQLGDGLSFSIFEQTNIQIPVIFCTAYDVYALDAFKNSGIDYILKPFSKETVSNALTKYFALKDKFTSQHNLIKNFVEEFQSYQKQRTTAIIVSKGDKMIPYELEKMALFFIDGSYVYGVTFEKEQVIVNQNLDKLETLTFPAFYRANRQFLVNRKAVKDVSHYFNRKLLVNLTFSFQQQIIVGKEKCTSFLSWLTQA